MSEFAVVSQAIDGRGRTWLSMWCVGCDDIHAVPVNCPDGWAWDGDEVRPTLTPSLLSMGGPNNVRCHSFITKGQWQYLRDCSHAQAGKTVAMPLATNFFEETE